MESLVGLILLLVIAGMVLVFRSFAAFRWWCLAALLPLAAHAAEPLGSQDVAKLRELAAQYEEHTKLVRDIASRIEEAIKPPPTPEPEPEPEPEPIPTPPPTPPVDNVTGLPFPLSPPQLATKVPKPIVVLGDYKLEKSLIFQGDGLCIAKSGVTVDLNGKTIYFDTAGTGAWGIRCYVRWYAEDKKRYGTPSQATEYANNVTIKNGCIVGLGTYGGDAHGISSEQCENLTIENCYISVGGSDNPTIGDTDGTYTIGSRWGKNTTIKNCTLICRQTLPVDRHLIPCNVRLPGGSTLIGSRLIGGNSGVKFVGACTIAENLIAHNAYVANGCGVLVGTDCKDSTVRDNIILPTSGHGLFVGGNPSGNKIEGNVVLARGIPNAEFMSDGPPMGALRLRDHPANNTITGNVFLAVAGGKYKRCNGITMIMRSAQKNVIEHNTVFAIRVGPAEQAGTRCYCHALGWETPDGGYTSDTISRNVLYANDTIIAGGGFDGMANQVEGVQDNLCGFVGGGKALGEFAKAALAKAPTGVTHPIVLAAIQQTVTSLTDIVQASVTPEHKTFASGLHGAETLRLTGLAPAGNLDAPVGFGVADFRNYGSSAVRVWDFGTYKVRMQGGTTTKQ